VIELYQWAFGYWANGGRSGCRRDRPRNTHQFPRQRLTAARCL